MALWNFMEQYLFPLFGDIPTEMINMGWFGQFSIIQILQLGFWIAIGWITIHFLVLLPYRWILSLMQVKRWRSK